MEYAFSQHAALKYGVDESILYFHLFNTSSFAIQKYNRDWCRCSSREIHQQLPFFGETKIAKLLKSLEEKKLIKRKKLSGKPVCWYFYFTKELELA